MKTSMLIVLAIVAVSVAGTAGAATYWWDGPVGTSLVTLNDWSTVQNTTTPNPTSLPGVGDDVVFAIDGQPASLQTLNLGGDVSYNSLLFRNDSGFGYRISANASGSTLRTLTVGAGGITIVPRATLITQCDIRALNGGVIVKLGADQTWRNFNADGGGGGTATLKLGNAADQADLDMNGKSLTLAGAGGVRLGGGGTGGRIVNGGAAKNITLGAKGLLRVQNTGAGVADRIPDNAGIVSYGGMVDSYLSSATTTYAETLGGLTLARGAFTHAQSQADAANTHVVTYGGGLTRSGSTATVLFVGTGLGSAADSRNRVILTGQADTDFIGPWATVSDGTLASGGTYGKTGFAGCTNTARGVYGIPGTSLPGTPSGTTAGVWSLDSAISLGGNLTVGALVCNNGSARTLILGTYTLTLTSGGLMFGANGPAVITKITASSGTLTAGSGSDTNLYVTVSIPNQTALKSIEAPIVNNGSGKISLVKSGAGTLTLTTNNTYTGVTVINEGTVNLSTNGSIATSPTIEIEHGGTLDVSAQSAPWTLGGSQTLKGSGSVAGNMNVSGTVAPGASAGSLSVTGNVVFANNAILEIEAKNALLGGDKWAPGYDRLTVAGTVDLGSNAKLNVSVLSGETLAIGDRLFIVDNDAADGVSGKFKTPSGTVLNEGDTFAIGGKGFKIYYAANRASGATSGGNDVALEVVNPPSGGAMIIIR